MDRCIVVHYHEVGLKGKNRPFFEEKLKENIQKTLKGLPYYRVRRIYGRLLIELSEGSPWEEIKGRLRAVFGIAYLVQAWATELDLEKIKEGTWLLLKDKEFASFKIDTRRARKDFPLNSPEINREVGQYILTKSARRVDLTQPDITCYLEIVENYAFIYFEKIKGPGGLPVSSGGKVAVLLSGGLDSPVAAYKMLKRGCRAIFIHFHSYPFTDRESQQKVKQIVEILSKYQFHSRLYLVPFADIQQRIIAIAPPSLRVILYRRYMLRIAQDIAAEERAMALVTGDSLGQVASQTLENICVISQAVQMPILRPLIGEDKEEIVSRAKEIGTYEISILPHQDCCSLFLPKQPETKARLGQVEEAEHLLEIDDAIAEAKNNILREELTAPYLT